MDIIFTGNKNVWRFIFISVLLSFALYLMLIFCWLMGGVYGVVEKFYF